VVGNAHVNQFGFAGQIADRVDGVLLELLAGDVGNVVGPANADADPVTPVRHFAIACEVVGIVNFTDDFPRLDVRLKGDVVGGIDHHVFGPHRKPPFRESVTETLDCDNAEIEKLPV
jgi:hypothetical protein